MGISFWKTVLFFLILMILGVLVFPSPRSMGLFYAKSRKFTDALPYLERQYERNTTDVLNTVRYLEALKYDGQFSIFEKTAAQALKISEKEWRLHEVLANYYEGRLQMAQASDHWRTILELNPELNDVEEKLKAYYLLNKRYERAIAIYKEQIRKSKVPLDLYYELAQLHALKRKWAETENAYLEIIRQFPGEADARLKLADMYEAKGEEDKALEFYRELNTLFPDKVDFVERFLVKLIETNRWADVKALLANYKNKFQNDSAFLSLLSGAYMDLNDKKEALRLLELLAQKNSLGTTDLSRLGELYFDFKEYAKARDFLNQYHEKTGGDYHSHHVLGDCLVALGDRDGGYREYEKALELIRQ